MWVHIGKENRERKQRDKNRQSDRHLYRNMGKSDKFGGTHNFAPKVEEILVYKMSTPKYYDTKLSNNKENIK